MSKIKFSFGGSDYSIDESALASASTDLKSHLSSVMNGTGATINLDGATYNIDSTKLSNTTNDFITHLETMTGDGDKIVVNRIEYSIDSTKANDIAGNLHIAFDKLFFGTTGGAVFDDNVFLSWDELQLEENGRKYEYFANRITNTEIGNSAFEYCTKLKRITIPDSVTLIGSHAFDYANLTHIVIPNNVGSIGSNAFDFCSNLKSITIGSGVTAFGEHTFTYCGVTNITVDANNPEYCSVDGNIFTKDKIGFIQYARGKTATSYIIPDSVTFIDMYAFAGGRHLTSVTIPDSVTEIGDYAFCECVGLTNITIPNGVTSIGAYVFSGCLGFTSITIPDRVTYIGYSAFSGCQNLTSITIPDSVTVIGELAFFGCKFETLYYTGTMAQWDTITKEDRWDFGGPIERIICSDGTITL